MNRKRIKIQEKRYKTQEKGTQLKKRNKTQEKGAKLTELHAQGGSRPLAPPPLDAPDSTLGKNFLQYAREIVLAAQKKKFLI